MCAGWLSGNSKEGVAWLDIDVGSCILDLSGMPFFPAKENRSLESGFPGGSYSKESACNAKDLDLVAGSEKSPGEDWQYWQSTPVFFPGESHGQRSLVGFSP